MLIDITEVRMNKILITAAICGAEVMKEHNPNVPYTVEEIVAEAKRSYDAGAAMIHLHVREDDGTPTQNKNRYKDCIEGIRDLCPDLIIQPSTGGAAGMTNDERLQPLELIPEMATLDCGSLNFGRNTIFENRETTIEYFAKRMQELKIKPEIEVFDRSMINTALRFARKGFIDGPAHFNLVLGLRGGIGASLDEFNFMVNSLPVDATYTATGIGRHQFNVVAMACINGGHVRVGFEDNIYTSYGVLAKSNGDLVEKAVRISRELAREIMTPAEARKMLHLD